MFEFALTHYQLVALLLLDFLRDPELIKHFISVLKASEIDDARDFMNLCGYQKRSVGKNQKISKEKNITLWFFVSPSHVLSRLMAECGEICKIDEGYPVL